MVVAEGFASTEAPVLALNPLAGDQVKESAPLAVNVTGGEPGHKDAKDGVTAVTGVGTTVVVTVPDEMPPQISVTVTV